MKARINHARSFVNGFPPAAIVIPEKLGKLWWTARWAKSERDHCAAHAPNIIKLIPATYPQSFSTYGRLSTPDPIADAHKAKILPLIDPFPSFENVLSLNCLPGDIENFESTILSYGDSDPLGMLPFLSNNGSMLASYICCWVPPLSSSSLFPLENNSLEEVLKEDLLPPVLSVAMLVAWEESLFMLAPLGLPWFGEAGRFY